jgi:hypothetical protein
MHAHHSPCPPPSLLIPSMALVHRSILE